MADREESVYMAKLAEQAVRREGIEVSFFCPQETHRVRGSWLNTYVIDSLLPA
jgi:hypothetical protein